MVIKKIFAQVLEQLNTQFNFYHILKSRHINEYILLYYILSLLSSSEESFESDSSSLSSSEEALESDSA